MHNKIVHMIAFFLLVIGGLNWLLVGAFQINLVEMIFGIGSLAMIVYILVGLSAIYELITHKSTCTVCNASASAAPTGGTEM